MPRDHPLLKRRYGGGPEIQRFWRTVHAGDAEEPRLALIVYPLRIEVLRKLKGPPVAELYIEKQARRATDSCL
jgi:hypothetical protein